SWAPARRYAEWSRSAISRAQMLSKGRSRRQLERQMRSLTGWSARALRGLARVEDALLLAAHSTHPRVSWARIAAEAGYADQSHLCREMRRYTGFSPQQLWRRASNEEDCGSTRPGLAVAALATTLLDGKIKGSSFGLSAPHDCCITRLSSRSRRII